MEKVLTRPRLVAALLLRGNKANTGLKSIELDDLGGVDVLQAFEFPGMLSALSIAVDGLKQC